MCSIFCWLKQACKYLFWDDTCLTFASVSHLALCSLCDVIHVTRFSTTQLNLLTLPHLSCYPVKVHSRFKEWLWPQAPHMSRRQFLSLSKTPIQGVERREYPQEGRWSKNFAVTCIWVEVSVALKCKIKCHSKFDTFLIWYWSHLLIKQSEYTLQAWFSFNFENFLLCFSFCSSSTFLLLRATGIETLRHCNKIEDDNLELFQNKCRFALNLFFLLKLLFFIN